jgi:hypothetical protein
MKFGDCPICGKGIIYEGGSYCSPDCWKYVAVVTGDASTASVPALGTVVAEPVKPPKQPPVTKGTEPTKALVRKWDPVLKRKRGPQEKEVLPDLGSEDDEPLGFLMSLED